MLVSYSKRSTSFFMNRALLDDSVSFNEEQHQLIESNSKYYQFGIDYTINKEHSLSASISSDGGTNETDIDSETDQFAFETLNNRQFSHNYSESRNNAYTLDLGYRYDIGDKGERLDFASSYGENKMDNSNFNKNELIDIINNTNTSNSNRDSQDQDHVKYSSRLDYTLPLKDKKGKFEVGIKYDI